MFTYLVHRRVSGADQKHSLSIAKVKHDRACSVTQRMDDRYVLRLRARPEISLQSNSVQALQKNFNKREKSVHCESRQKCILLLWLDNGDFPENLHTVCPC